METKHTPWIVSYHHRHGTDCWIEWTDGPMPDLEEVAANLDGFEPDRDEYIESHGVAPLPPMLAAAPDLLIALQTIALHAPSLDATGIRDLCDAAIARATNTNP